MEQRKIYAFTTKAGARKVRRWFAARSILTKITPTSGRKVSIKPIMVEVLVPTNPAILPSDIMARVVELLPQDTEVGLVYA